MFKARAIGISVVVTVILGVAASPASASRSVTWEVPSSCIDSEEVVTADPPPGQPARSATGRVNILLPDGYDGRKRFPVLYLLHGANSAYDYWLDWSNGELTRAVADLPAVIVMPDAGMYGSWNNLWNGGRREPCYESYVLDGLIPLVQRRLQIRTGRRWHAVAGLSGGGLGAMNFASQEARLLRTGALVFRSPRPGDIQRSSTACWTRRRLRSSTQRS